jgi:hypothetical protein
MFPLFTFTFTTKAQQRNLLSSAFSFMSESIGTAHAISSYCTVLQWRLLSFVTLGSQFWGHHGNSSNPSQNFDFLYSFEPHPLQLENPHTEPSSPPRWRTLLLPSIELLCPKVCSNGVCTLFQSLYPTAFFVLYSGSGVEMLCTGNSISPVASRLLEWPMFKLKKYLHILRNLSSDKCTIPRFSSYSSRYDLRKFGE